MNPSLSLHKSITRGNDNVEGLDYECGPSSIPVALTDRCEVYEDDANWEDEVGDDEREGDGGVQHDVNVSSFLTLHQVMQIKQGRYVSVDVAGCNFSNNSNLEDLIESSLIQYHLEV